MFNIYIRDFKKNGSIITTETLMQTIPSDDENGIKLISPIVKNEMGNAESFNFSMESGSPFYDAFLQMKTYIRVEYDGDTIFYGRVLTINNGFYGTRQIQCEGPLTFFNDSPVEGVKEKNRSKVSVKSFITKLINGHNEWVSDSKRTFAIGEVPGYYTSAVSEEQKISNADQPFGQDSWTDTKSALEDLRSHTGGFFRTRYSNGTLYLDLLNHYFNSTVNNQIIEVGQNVLDLSSVNEIDNIFTELIPIGTNNTKNSTGYLYISGYKTDIHGSGRSISVPDICKVYSQSELDSGYHTYDDYASALNRYGKIYKIMSFNDATTKSDLFDAACKWIKDNYQGEVPKFTVKAIDMHQIGSNVSKIMVGDRVKIRCIVSDENGNPVKRELSPKTCIAISYDLNNPENNSYTFGIPANILTKTYGLHKQSKSVDSGASTPSSGSSGVGDGDKSDWINEVRSWLMRHKIWYHKGNVKGPKPWKKDYETQDNRYRYESGPESEDYKNKFYTTEGVIAMGYNFSLYKFAKSRTYFDDTYDPDVFEVIFRQDHAEGREYKRLHTVIDWAYSRVNIEGTLTVDLIYEHNIIEYVQYEYGFDLRNGLSVKMPKVVEMGDGSVVTNSEDPNNGFVVTQSVLDNDGHKFYGPDGQELVSMQDEKGNWHYYEYDPETGEPKEVYNIRDLHLTSVESENRIGWVVTENEDGELEFANPGEMTLAIEKFAEGELVVSRQAGELMYIGNKKTQMNIAVATTEGGTVTGFFDYEKDSDGIPHVVIKSGGGVRTRRYKLDTTKNPPEYVYDKNGDHIMTEVGLYDDDNLVAGIITEKINDQPCTLIRGHKIYVGQEWKDGQKLEKDVISALRDAHVIEDYEDVPGTIVAPRLVAQSVYVEDIAGINAEFQNIKVNYLNAQWITSTVADADHIYVKEIIGRTSSSAKSYAEFDIFQGGIFRGTSYNIEYPIGPGETGGYDLKNSVAYASVTLDENTNVYTLHLFRGDKVEITDKRYPSDSMTFSRATSLSGEWSGDNTGDTASYTVLASPQGTDISTSITLYINQNAAYIKDPDGTIRARLTNTPYSGVTVDWIGLAKNYSPLDDTEVRTNFYIEADASNGAKKTDELFWLTRETYTVNGKQEYCVNVKNTKPDNNNENKDLIIARINIQNVYTNGYNAGWTAAYNKITIPASNTSSANFIFYEPPSTVDGSAEAHRFKIVNSGNNAVLVNYVDEDDELIRSIAKYTHNKYNGGWNACRTAMDIPTSAISDVFNNSFVVKKPDADAASTKTSYTYSMSARSDFQPTGVTKKSNCIELKYNSNVVARMELTGYTKGTFTQASVTLQGDDVKVTPISTTYIKVKKINKYNAGTSTKHDRGSGTTYYLRNTSPLNLKDDGTARHYDVNGNLIGNYHWYHSVTDSSGTKYYTAGSPASKTLYPGDGGEFTVQGSLNTNCYVTDSSGTMYYTADTQQTYYKAGTTDSTTYYKKS